MMGFALLEYLSAKGHLRPGSKILDVGSQNLVNCSVEGMTGFAEQFRGAPLTDADRSEIARQFYFSTPRPGERTLFVGEFLELTNIVYRGIDVCPAPHTDIVDLNFQSLPDAQRESYDIVLNLGTTEHIVGQTNVHAYIHDALKVGGVVLHQPPSVGWCNHGYFAYHPLFYRDLAKANGYEILDIWYSLSCEGPSLDTNIPVRSARDPLGEDQAAPASTAPWYNLNVILRKTTSAPFRLKLELETSHSTVDRNVANEYQAGRSNSVAGQTAGRLDGVSASELVAILLQRAKNRVFGR